jgi:hypothetical protein
MNNKSNYIEQFRELYKKKSGKILTDDEALALFERLAEIVHAIYQQIPIDILLRRLLLGGCALCGHMVVLEWMTHSEKEELLISGMCRLCQNKTFK